MKPHSEFRKRKDPEIEINARAVFANSMRRARHRCPRWARTAEFRERFLRVYRDAQRRNFIQRYIPESKRLRFHVDHIVPLGGENVCGLHVPWNLHAIPAQINMAKGTLIVPEWRDSKYAPRLNYNQQSPRTLRRSKQRAETTERQRLAREARQMRRVVGQTTF